MYKYFFILLLGLIQACGNDRSTSPRSLDFVVPEFIFQVDFGAPGGGEDFWFEWAEAQAVLSSQRTVQPVFDQNPLRMNLRTCPESPGKSCDPKQRMQFLDRGDVTATDIPLVLRDGVVMHTNSLLTLDPLPVGRYEIEIFFHDASRREGGQVEVEMLVGDAVVHLGLVQISTGSDASSPSRIVYPFNITDSKPIHLRFRCVSSGYIINGFRLLKFFGGPTGPEPQPDPPERQGFMSPALWSLDFGAYSLDSWVQPGGWGRFGSMPRLVADVNGDGLADIVGFANDGVYVALSDGERFLEPRRWLTDFTAYRGNFASQYRKPRILADVNGNGMADIVGFDAAGVYVALSDGQRFLPKQRWSNDFDREDGWRNTDFHPRWLADVTGDGRADIIAAKNEGIYLARSESDRFADAQLVLRDFALDLSHSFNWSHADRMPRLVADLNGNGLGDVLGFAEQGLWAAMATGQGFGAKSLVNSFFRAAAGWDSFERKPRFVGRLGGRQDLADVIGFKDRKAYLVLDVLEQSAGIELPTLSEFMARRAEFNHFNFDNTPIQIADVTGNGWDDVIFFLTDATYVAVNRGIE